MRSCSNQVESASAGERGLAGGRGPAFETLVASGPGARRGSAPCKLPKKTAPFEGVNVFKLRSDSSAAGRASSFVVVAGPANVVSEPFPPPYLCAVATGLWSSFSPAARPPEAAK